MDTFITPDKPYPPNYPPEIPTAIAEVMSANLLVEKRGTNQFHNYKFAKMGDVVTRLQPLMAKAGIVTLQSEDKTEFLDNGNVLSITYKFTLAHASGAVWPEKLEQTGMAACRNSKGGFDDKAANKCYTAAEKYFLIGLFKVPTGDETADPDGDEGTPAQNDESFVADAIKWIRAQTDPAAINAAWSAQVDRILALSQALRDQMIAARDETLAKLRPPSQVAAAQQHVAQMNAMQGATAQQANIASIQGPLAQHQPEPEKRDPRDIWVNEAMAWIGAQKSLDGISKWWTKQAEHIKKLEPSQLEPLVAAKEKAKQRITGIGMPADPGKGPILIDDEIKF